MTTDSIFKIASMTKPITAAAVMILAEEGQLSPVDPVERYLPEFRGQKMYLSREGDKVTLGPPSARDYHPRPAHTHIRHALAAAPRASKTSS
ncbi:MAG: serine hydrolase domain-containing protein [Bryobacterales bacterium]